MFLQNTYKFLRGFIKVRAEGYFVERLLNLCQTRDIETWDVLLRESGTIEFKMRARDYRKLKEIAKITHSELEMLGEEGTWNFLKKYKKRKIFLMAGVFAVITIYLLSLRIWSIEVVGNEKISIADIKAELHNEGIVVGVTKDKLDFNTVKSNIYLRRNDILWLGFKVNGTKMIVEVLERKNPIKDDFQNVPCNIIAEKDGIIDNIYVKQGTKCVDVGDVVFKGDVIVSGIVTSEYSDTKEVSANAEITMKTWYTEKVAIPYEKSIIVKSGNIDYDYKLKVRKLCDKFIK